MTRLRLVWTDRRGGCHTVYADDTTRIGPTLERLARRGIDAMIYDSTDQIVGESFRHFGKREWWWDRDAKAAAEGKAE